MENGGKGGEEGWVDDFLEIGSGVTGAPGSGHAVDNGGLWYTYDTSSSSILGSDYLTS